MIVDTGATTNILGKTMYRNICQHEVTELQPTTKWLFAYGSDSELTILEKFDAAITFNDKHEITTIHAIQGNHSSLLS